ncbi:lysozyme inhibitor LprI family protein [Phenylobacterium sp. VNQ135]|uniref:lysozyme inhibitor LprI family protein n=1 Tax=Phenylobacterium sp. VNQ135 TaxID=3400922 RepID=UPI003BFC2933
MVGATDARAASFDCKKAATPVEKLICGSITLEMLDLQLKGAFDGALDRSNKPDAVRAEQARWLRGRDICRDEACLEAAYRERIEALMSISDKPPECDGETTLGMNQCGAIYADRATRELERYLAAARARLVNDANDTTADEGARAALQGFDEAQKRWLLYREAECGAVFDWWRTGTIRTWMSLSCTTEMTKARTRQVWSNWLGFADNTPPLLPEPRPERRTD